MIHAVLLLCPFLFAQDDEGPVKIKNRKLELTFHVRDQSGVSQKELWVKTPDTEWKPVMQTGVKILGEWSELHGGKITVRVEFPGDGEYWLYGRFGDGVTNKMSLPHLAPPRLHKHFLVRGTDPEGGPVIRQPTAGDNLLAGANTVIRWITNEEQRYQEGTVSIYYKFGKAGGWTPIVEKQQLAGTYEWIVPTAMGVNMRMRAIALDQMGKEMIYDSGELIVRGGVRPPPPRLLYPEGGELWDAGRAVKLRWVESRGQWKPKSAAVYYRVGDRPWVLITKGLENTGFYYWSPPRKETRELQMAVSVTSTDGEPRMSAASGKVRVRLRDWGDMPTAMLHYDRARVLHARGRSDEAVAEYERALAAWPNYPEALHELARLHYEREEYARALEFYLRARECSTSSPWPYVNLGKTQIKLKLFVEAFTDLKSAVQLGVDRNRRLAISCSEALMELGLRFAATDQMDLAVEAFQHVLRIRNADPDMREQVKQYLEWIYSGEKTALPTPKS
ncbi:MAG: tetratricopeptide repeat protein [Planctomycetota bacterium]|jgi:hypothetical protein